MVTASPKDGHPIRMVACTLTDDQLLEQFEGGIMWLSQQGEDITQSKFRVDLAWFRELHWEVMRRGLEWSN